MNKFGYWKQTTRLRSYWARYSRKLALGVGCVALSNTISLIAPFVVRLVIDGLTLALSQSRLLAYGGLLVLIAAARGVTLFFQRWLIVGVAREVEFLMRNDFYAHLQKLSLDFYRRNRTGDLMARATSDLAIVRNAIGLGFISGASALFTLILILPVMLITNWQLALVTFGPLVLLAITARFFSFRIRERSRSAQESLGKLSSTAQESFAGVRIVRALARESLENAKFEQAVADYRKRNLSLIHLSSVLRPLMQFLVGVSFVAVFLFGGNLVLRGIITTGQFVQQMMYVGLLVGPIATFSLVINIYERALASLARVDAILSLEPVTGDAHAIESNSSVNGAIEFRNLTFTHSGAAEPTLKNINLRIDQGQNVAFVGSVGAGKSTLMNLICRLLESSPGELLIDGRSVNTIPLTTLRETLSYVPQETVLFSDSIAGNIAFGIDQPRTDQLEAAATHAAIAADISCFATGYETMVGERGVTLSGGQKQRIALARALIREPRIIILDDSLSAVDALTEKDILDHLRRQTRGCTSLFVSHRPRTVQDADLIVVMKDGEIVQRGTHHQLIKQEGLYADLYRYRMIEERLNAR